MSLLDDEVTPKTLSFNFYLFFRVDGVNLGS